VQAHCHRSAGTSKIVVVCGAHMRKEEKCEMNG
jgi:hypothetical protein